MDVEKIGSGIAIAETVEAMYAEGQTDYSLEPIVLVSQQGHRLVALRTAMLLSFAAGEASARFNSPKHSLT